MSTQPSVTHCRNLERARRSLWKSISACTGGEGKGRREERKEEKREGGEGGREGGRREEEREGRREGGGEGEGIDDEAT